MEPELEVLVVLSEHDAAAAMRDLSATGAVTQALPPRLALARPDEGTVERLTAVPGVRAIYHADDAPDVQDLDLSEDEALFVSAWQLRARPKTRLGDGLPWDAPGFVPPDPPS